MHNLLGKLFGCACTTSDESIRPQYFIFAIIHLAHKDIIAKSFLQFLDKLYL